MRSTVILGFLFSLLLYGTFELKAEEDLSSDPTDPSSFTDDDMNEMLRPHIEKIVMARMEEKNKIFELGNILVELEKQRPELDVEGMTEPRNLNEIFEHTRQLQKYTEVRNDLRELVTDPKFDDDFIQVKKTISVDRYLLWHEARLLQREIRTSLNMQQKLNAELFDNDETMKNGEDSVQNYMKILEEIIEKLDAEVNDVEDEDNVHFLKNFLKDEL